MKWAAEFVARPARASVRDWLGPAEERNVGLKLEVVVVPVSDVDRAKEFYGITSAAPGSLEGLQFLATDVEEARAELLDRGVDVGEVFHDRGGSFYHLGTDWQERDAGSRSVTGRR